MPVCVGVALRLGSALPPSFGRSARVGVEDQSEVVGALVVGGDLAVDVFGVVAVWPRWLPSGSIRPARIASNIALNSFSDRPTASPGESTSPRGTGGDGLAATAKPGHPGRPASTACFHPGRPNRTAHLMHEHPCCTISQRRRNSSIPARMDE